MKHTKQIRVKSALPIYIAAAAFALFSLILPIYRIWAIAAAGLLSAGAWFIGTRLFPDRVREVEEEVFTGDPELDAQIRQSREILSRFREAAESLGDTDVKNTVNRIAESGENIIDEVIRDKGDRGDANTFFSYYMPTLDRLLSFYTGFALSGTGENALSSRARIEQCLAIVADAFEKFRDKLFRNEAVEIKASVDVMKMMLRSEGLADKKSDVPADAGLDDIMGKLRSEAEMEKKQIAQASH